MAAPDDDDPYGLLKKDVTQDDLIGLGGGLFGLQVVCHMLARWVARQDPNFTQESRAEFDKMLGVLHLVISEVLPITRELGLSTNKPTIADSPIVKRALIGGREVFAINHEGCRRQGSGGRSACPSEIATASHLRVAGARIIDAH